MRTWTSDESLFSVASLATAAHAHAVSKYKTVHWRRITDVVDAG